MNAVTNQAHQDPFSQPSPVILAKSSQELRKIKCKPSVPEDTRTLAVLAQSVVHVTTLLFTCFTSFCHCLYGLWYQFQILVRLRDQTLAISGFSRAKSHPSINVTSTNMHPSTETPPSSKSVAKPKDPGTSH